MAEDLRRYARQTRFQLVLGFLMLLFVVGDGLIYLIYGREAAVLGLVCLASGFIPVIGIEFFFWLGKQVIKSQR